jgi:hypothetical protein
MGGFAYGGSLTNSAPIERVYQVAETCYTGQMLAYANMAIAGGNAPGEVRVLDPATTAADDTMPIAGACTSVVTQGDAGYSGTTGYGDTATADTTQAAQKANEPVDMTLVKVTLAIPWTTLFNGPVYNATYGVALTELVETSGDTGGVTCTHSGQTGIDLEDDYSVMYCRSGGNKGHYRQTKTGGTTAQVAGVAFPYGIATGDVFVTAPGSPGNCGLDVGSTANFIDGAVPLNGTVHYFSAYLHVQDLEESGKENYTFAFLPSACCTIGWQAL